MINSLTFLNLNDVNSLAQTISNSPLPSPLAVAWVTESDLWALNFERDPRVTVNDVTSWGNGSPPADWRRFAELEGSAKFIFCIFDDFFRRESGRKNDSRVPSAADVFDCLDIETILKDNDHHLFDAEKRSGSSSNFG